MPKGIYKRGIIKYNPKQGFQKGNTGYWLGKKRLPLSKKLKEKISNSLKGEKNYQWQGEKVNYRNLHRWVTKWKGKPNKCENCGTETAKKFEWANVDRKYRRVLEDYIRMCTSCHRQYDYGK